jgi:hypothetical protein
MSKSNCSITSSLRGRCGLGGGVPRGLAGLT